MKTSLRQVQQQSWILAASAVFCSLSAHGQMRCPEDKRVDGASTRFVISIGTVTMPVGAFLLVRNGGQVGAIRLTSFDPVATQYQGKSNYESFFLPDKSTSFTAKNVERQAGEIYIGPTTGVHAVYTHTAGHNTARAGKWIFYFSYPTLMNMSHASFWKGEREEGYEFAPTSACNLAEIDAADKGLRWFRWDRTTRVTMLLADLPK